MIQIRQNTFETNSSSTHSLVICTMKQFEDLKKNKLYIYENDTLIDLVEARAKVEKYYPSRLVELDEAINDQDYESVEEIFEDCCIETYENWKDYKHDRGLETYSRHFESPSGDKLVAWGHYGYDG